MADRGAGNVKVATKADWYWGPRNRWAWRNMRRLFPTARVGRAPSGVAVLPEALQEEIGDILFQNPSDGSRATVVEMLATTYTDAFIVLKHGRILFERYFNGMRPDETHLLMSVTKSIVGALIGVLVEQERLAPDLRLEDVMPEHRETSFSCATLRHLIDMSVAGTADPSGGR